ncbi:MAG: Stp1/IreP family PP2C-type Ser/Thr phosphatase [Proteobacteria bacterium]|nr:Stp1/IreP family PP2C-type Ser/Thr phosphatase [Pseudomonadota bacterium]
MRLRGFGKTDIGKKRKVNQDAFLIDATIGFFIVADGMGGHAAGEVASELAVETVHDMVLRGRDVIADFVAHPITNDSSRAIRRLLESAVQSATYMVFGMAEQNPDKQGMGTTISALLIVGAYAVTAQVGDSRIYCIRDNETLQLTEDHTLINWQIKEGLLTPEQATYAPHKNVITRAVGNKDYVQVDTQVLAIRLGDRFMLCSDGLHGYLERHEIAEICGGNPPQSLEDACDALIDLANLRGGKDNITAVMAELLPEQLSDME